MADEQLDLLEERIKCLENIVFGTSDKDALYPKGYKEHEECIESLSAVQNQTKVASQGKRRVNTAFGKVLEIQAYLDPSYTDELTLSDSAKADVILAEEDFIRQQATRLETLEGLGSCMDTQHLKALPGLSTKLQELSHVQVNQQDQTADMATEVQGLLEAYNSVVSLMSKQFVQWDEVITKLEIAAAQK